VSKLLIVCVVFFVSGAFMIGTYSSRNQSKIDALEKSPDRGKLKWYAEMAKAKGEKQILFRSAFVEYGVARSLDEALANYNVVVAQPIQSLSFATGPLDIQTWYRFRIIDELSTSGVQCATCSFSQSPPPEMLPLHANEFLASKEGGEITVDGIKLISVDPDFPPFAKGKRYLLFLSFNNDETIAALQMGPWAAYEIQPSGNLEPVNKKFNHKLKHEIENDFGNSLDQLAAKLRGRAKTK